MSCWTFKKHWCVCKKSLMTKSKTVFSKYLSTFWKTGYPNFQYFRPFPSPYPLFSLDFAWQMKAIKSMIRPKQHKDHDDWWGHFGRQDTCLQCRFLDHQKPIFFACHPQFFWPVIMRHRLGFIDNKKKEVSTYLRYWHLGCLYYI